jgi:pimeloyl-ACP methyl ester carboxylesterase
MSHCINYKNINVHYTDQGKGRAIVLLHGFLGDLSMWNNLADQLSKKNRVIAIDLLGHGKSGSFDKINTMEAMADAVHSVIRHLKLRRFILLGHSMGGYVGLAFAEKFPEQLLGLGLLNTTALADTTEKKKNRNRAIEAVKENNKVFIRLTIPNLFSEKNKIIFKKEIDDLINSALLMQPESIIAALKGMQSRVDRCHVLRNESYKKLLIIGLNDPILNYQSFKLQTKKTNVDTVEISGGHMSYIENIEEFTYNIMHFIEKL